MGTSQLPGWLFSRVAVSQPQKIEWYRALLYDFQPLRFWQSYGRQSAFYSNVQPDAFSAQ